MIKRRRTWRCDQENDADGDDDHDDDDDSGAKQLNS